ncbi:hypothetical protein J6590_091101 [Homalodisca vitripennis]|nr:hypothetical protein J6590_091101 [Homalodisca vitripennis]
MASNTNSDDSNQVYVPLDLDQCPSSEEWIKKLKSAQAKQQCAHWNLLPAATLDENRAILRNFLRSKNLLGTVKDKYPKLDLNCNVTETEEQPPNFFLQKNLPREQQTPAWQQMILEIAAAIGHQINSFVYFSECLTQIRP